MLHEPKPKRVVMLKDAIAFDLRMGDELEVIQHEWKPEAYKVIRRVRDGHVPKCLVHKKSCRQIYKRF